MEARFSSIIAAESPSFSDLLKCPTSLKGYWTRSMQKNVISWLPALAICCHGSTAITDSGTVSQSHLSSLVEGLSAGGHVTMSRYSGSFYSVLSGQYGS
ncbi:hypothetical protein STEG23_037834, partial [Scotinomys teguina]